MGWTENRSRRRGSPPPSAAARNAWTNGVSSRPAWQGHLGPSSRRRSTPAPCPASRPVTQSAVACEGRRASSAIGTMAHRRGSIANGPSARSSTGPPTAFDPIVGAAQARSAYDVDGSGMTVAVIDTGVDYNNSALGGGFGPGTKVIAGYDFADQYRRSRSPPTLPARHGRRRADRLERPERPGRGARREHRRPQGRRRQQHGQPAAASPTPSSGSSTTTRSTTSPS